MKGQATFMNGRDNEFAIAAGTHSYSSDIYSSYDIPQVVEHPKLDLKYHQNLGMIRSQFL